MEGGEDSGGGAARRNLCGNEETGAREEFDRDEWKRDLRTMECEVFEIEKEVDVWENRGRWWKLEGKVTSKAQITLLGFQGDLALQANLHDLNFWNQLQELTSLLLWKTKQYILLPLACDQEMPRR